MLKETSKAGDGGFAFKGCREICAISASDATWRKSSHPRWADHRLRQFLVLVLILSALGSGAWLERNVLLQGAADLWVVSDPITPADAVVVLGGGADVRPFIAAHLYAKGLVRKILVSRVEEARLAKIGIIPEHTRFNLGILRTLGVPDGAIEVFGIGSKNTWDEAVALKTWTERHETSALIVPAEV